MKPYWNLVKKAVRFEGRLKQHIPGDTFDRPANQVGNINVQEMIEKYVISAVETKFPAIDDIPQYVREILGNLSDEKEWGPEIKRLRNEALRSYADDGKNPHFQGRLIALADYLGKYYYRFMELKYPKGRPEKRQSKPKLGPAPKPPSGSWGDRNWGVQKFDSNKMNSFFKLSQLYPGQQGYPDHDPSALRHENDYEDDWHDMEGGLGEEAEYESLNFTASMPANSPLIAQARTQMNQSPGQTYSEDPNNPQEIAFAAFAEATNAFGNLLGTNNIIFGNNDIEMDGGEYTLHFEIIYKNNNEQQMIMSKVDRAIQMMETKGIRIMMESSAPIDLQRRN